MCISIDLGRIWPNEVYVDEIYDHTKPSKVVYMLSMHVYIKYVVILIIYYIYYNNSFLHTRVVTPIFNKPHCICVHTCLSV
jgi:hypothetical protein